MLVPRAHILCPILALLAAFGGGLVTTCSPEHRSGTAHDGASPSPLSVSQVVENTTTYENVQILVTGLICPDGRAKLDTWPEPARSDYILQDSGHCGAGGQSGGIDFIQAYSTTVDFQSYVEETVVVTARLLVTTIQIPVSSDETPFWYLEVSEITKM